MKTADLTNREAGITAGDFRSTVTPEPHVHDFGGSGRCSCGKHREPARATSLEPGALAIFNDLSR